MTHGGPDWGTGGPLATVFTLEDMAELAARLGSIDTFDRRGNILWFDDFENTLHKWATHYSGTDGSVSLSAIVSRNGAFSARLVTGNLTGNDAWLYRFFTPPRLSKLGFEISFAFQTTYATIIFAFNIDDGVDESIAEIRYTIATSKLEYRGADAAWHALQTIRTYSTLVYFHTMKLVIDPLTNKYVRLLWDTTEFDLSAISYYCEEGGGDVPEMAVYIKGESGEDVNAIMHLDDAILTQNEP